MKNGTRVRYIGKEKHLKDLEGVVTRDTVAANGNILVKFDKKDKPTVINPKNLAAIGGTFVPVSADAKGVTLVKVNNPKDEAVLTYYHARSARSTINVEYDKAKKRLSDLGLISTDEQPVGHGVPYESNAVRLVATTAEPGSQITEASLRTALTKAGATPGLIETVVDLATLPKKAATTYTVEIK